MSTILKQVCPNCGSGYMTKPLDAPDTEWRCAKCNNPVDFKKPKYQLTAFGRRMAWLPIVFVILMAIAQILIVK